MATDYNIPGRRVFLVCQKYLLLLRLQFCLSDPGVQVPLSVQEVPECRLDPALPLHRGYIANSAIRDHLYDRHHTVTRQQHGTERRCTKNCLQVYTSTASNNFTSFFECLDSDASQTRSFSHPCLFILAFSLVFSKECFLPA